MHGLPLEEEIGLVFLCTPNHILYNSPCGLFLIGQSNASPQMKLI